MSKRQKFFRDFVKKQSEANEEHSSLSEAYDSDADPEWGSTSKREWS